MVLEPPDDRKQSAQLLKVKRRRGEEVLQALLYQDGETHAFYQLAGQEPHLPAGPIDKGPECAADIVKELQVALYHMVLSSFRLWENDARLWLLLLLPKWKRLASTTL